MRIDNSQICFCAMFFLAASRYTLFNALRRVTYACSYHFVILRHKFLKTNQLEYFSNLLLIKEQIFDGLTKQKV